MREDYIRLIKEHILANPDFKYTLSELRANLLSYGITEEELNEAIRQLTQGFLAKTQPSKIELDLKKTKEEIEKELSETKSEINKLQETVLLRRKDDEKDEDEGAFRKRKKPRMQKLLMLDIASHVAIAVFLVAAVAIFSVWFVGRQYTNRQLASMISDVSKNENVKDFLVTQVYAHTQPIDATRIFSFPASNISLALTGTPKREVLGFFPYWMLSTEDKISLNGLTSIALFGLETDGGGNIITVHQNGEIDGGWAMWNDSKLDDFIKRAKRKRLKIQITLKSFDNANIEKLVSSEKAQKTFISNVLHLIDAKSLDGVNIDFEYVGSPDPKVKDDFTRLITNLATALVQQTPNALLTVDTYVNSASVPGIFDIEALSNTINAFVVMGYDMHTPLGSPGPIAPMEGNISIIGYMQSFLEKILPEKLILAVPYYGYDWPVPAASNANPSLVKIIPYAELAQTSKDTQISWDDTAQTPLYRYTDPITDSVHEVHFENTRSLGVKYDFVNRKNLKGIGIWALGYDGLNADLRQLIIEKFGQ